MDDALGKAVPHSVIHRKASYDIQRKFPGVYRMPNAIGSNYEWLDPEYGPRNGFYYSKQTMSPLTVWNTSHNSTNPPRWTIASPVANESALIEDCFEKASQLKADVLLNIAEANQAWPAVQSLANCLPEMARNWKVIRKLVKTASGAYLAWKFGVSPILSDIKSIRKYLPEIGKQLKRHTEDASSRYSVTAQGKASFDATPTVYLTINGHKVREATYQGRVTLPPIVRYVLVVKPNTPPGVSDLYKQMDFAMGRFSSSPASFAWEKVPFSFVADWFVDLRGVCRGIDKALGHSPYKAMSFTRSYSYQLSTDAFWVSRSVCNGATQLDTRAGSADYSHYERILVPDSAQLPTWKPRFGKNQAGISAALLGQKLSSLFAKR
jgi:hypothetical protein